MRIFLYVISLHVLICNLMIKEQSLRPVFAVSIIIGMEIFVQV